MLISLILMAAVAAGGFSLTYLIDEDGPFLWRAALGAAVGSAVFGTLSFVLGMIAGLNVGTVAGALVLTLAPIALLFRGRWGGMFRRDWARAKGKLQGASGAKAARFVYYAALALLFLLFFSQTMYETAEGLYTGGSNNLGDLPFHLGAIFSFSDGGNFPPINPSFAGAKFTYPFISDLPTACFMKLGAPLREAMFVQNAAWAFALLVALERFTLQLVGDRFAAKLAPALLFFSGGLGFLWFLGDFSSQAKGFFEFLGTIPKDYTIGDEFRWGNSLIVLFMTQRSLLLGMPLTIAVLGVLWRVFNAETKSRGGSEGEKGFELGSVLPLFVTGLLAGLLPLVHLHSLAVLFVITAFLFFFRLDRWKEWIAFGVGVAVLALPQLIWSLTGSATETTKFFGWHFGWDARGNNVLWFWVKNTGLFFPILAAGIFLFCFTQRRGDAKEDGKVEERKPFNLLLFYIPFAALFIISNTAKLAPWEWDNIKVLIYWFVGSLPFVAYAIAWMWHKGTGLKIAAAVCILLLTASGALDVWRTISGQNKLRVFEADGVKLSDRIRKTMPTKAMFLNAPTYNSVVALTGRQSLMRYPGHLASHGIDYGSRESEVREVYSGGPGVDNILAKYGIDYVVLGPEERGWAMDPARPIRLNEAYLRKFPVAAESGQYKIYKVR